MTNLNLEQVQRYSRHIVMPEVGGVGQRKLLAAKVLIVGMGGLGSPAALYLAAAGVGTLGLVDDDKVELSNLQRQVLYRDEDIGKPKVAIAKERLTAQNPDIDVNEHQERLTNANALAIMGEYDIVLNGADNFDTRYLVNDAAYLLKKPLVDGSILKFEAQLSTYIAGRGCYRCIFPTAPTPGTVPSCSEAGVMGALAGLVGSIQALEVVKLIIGSGEPLSGSLLLIDALTMEFKRVTVRRDPDCELCGDDPKIKTL